MAGPTQYILSLVVRAKDEASSIFGGITAKVTALLGALSAFLGVKAFAGAVQDAAEFEKAMDRVAAKIDDISEENFARLKTSAEEASKATGRSAVEAAEGLEILAGAGYKTEEAIATLPVVLKIATLEATSLEEAALAVADSMTVMGLAKTDVAKAGDILAKGAGLEATTILELAEAIREGGASAKAFGFDLEKTVAILDIFAKNGLRGSEAGTALTAMLQELANPASKARQTLAALGDTTGTLEGAINTLTKAGARGELAILDFGDEAGPGLRALLKDGVAGLNEYENKLRAATGTMDEASRVLSSNLITAWERFLSVLDNVKRFLLQPLLKPFTDELNILTKDLDAASKSPAFAQLQTTIKQVFLEGTAAVKEFIANFNLKDVIQAVEDFSKSVSDNLQIVKVTFSGIGNTLNLAFQGIAAAVDTLRLSWNLLLRDSEGIDAALKRLEERGNSVNESFSNIGDAFNAASSAITDSGEAIQKTQTKVEALAEVNKWAAESAQALATWQGEAGKSAEESAVQVEDASTKIVDAKEAEREANNQLQEQVAKLREEYQQMLTAGDTQQAAETLLEINRLLKQTADEANNTGEALTTAFAQLGIKSQAELNNLTKGAEQAFITIRDSGVASTADIQAAWIAYAKKAVEGAQNLSDTEKTTLAIKLQIQSAIYGTKDAYDSLAKSLGQATKEAENLAATEEEAVAVSEQVADSAEKVGQSIKGWSSDLANVKIAFAQIGDLSGTAFDTAGIQNYQSAVNEIQHSLDLVDPLLTAISSALSEVSTEAGRISLQLLLREADSLAGTMDTVRGQMEETARTAAEDLRQGIADAREEMEAFAGQQKEALNDRLKALEDYRAEGDKLRQEELRHERELVLLQEEWNLARQQGNRDAMAAIQEQINAEAELHRLKIADLNEQQKVQETIQEETQISEVRKYAEDLNVLRLDGFIGELGRAESAVDSLLSKVKELNTAAEAI